MQPLTILGPVGDNPAKATLHYGSNVLDALRLLPDNSINMVCTYMSKPSTSYTIGGKEGSRLRKDEGYKHSIVMGKPQVKGLKTKDLVGVPWRVALALQADGWWLRNDIIWQKGNAMPSSVKDRFSCKYEHVFLLSKSERYFFDLEAVKVPLLYGAGQASENVALKNPGDIWMVNTTSYKGAHFAVWPETLVEPMVKAGTSEKGRCPTCKTPWQRITEKKDGVPGADGKPLRVPVTIGWVPSCDCDEHAPERCVVLDTFSGSGTTGVVAMSLGRDYVGLDISKKYRPLASARLQGLPAPLDDDDGGSDLIGDLFK